MVAFHLELGAGLPTVAKVFVLRYKNSNEINGSKWPVTPRAVTPERKLRFILKANEVRKAARY
jgi:hypothetical protein